MTDLMKKIQCIGVSHRTASIHIREHYSLSPEDALHFYYAGRDNGLIEELFLLSTCNRTEIYGIVNDSDFFAEWVARRFQELGRAHPDSPKDPFLIRTGEEAARHLFRVSCGMDSMMLGETQITAQVRDAFGQARSASASGPILNRLVQMSLEAGKRVRTETSLSGRAISVSYAAVQQAAEIFPDFSKVTVLLVGAGSVGQLTAGYFRKKDVRKFFISNRSEKRGKALANELQGSFVALHELGRILSGIQIAVACTSAKTPLFELELLKKSLEVRSNSVLLLDLSVPRNIQPEVSDLPCVTLYTIDDLKSVVADNIARRERELPQAERVIDEVLDKFNLWLRTLAVAPTIRQLRRSLDDIKHQEIQKVQNSYSPETLEVINQVSDRLIRRLLKDPISALKAHAESGDEVSEFVLAVRALYDLDHHTGDA